MTEQVELAPLPDLHLRQFHTYWMAQLRTATLALDAAQDFTAEDMDYGGGLCVCANYTPIQEDVEEAKAMIAHAEIEAERRQQGGRSRAGSRSGSYGEMSAPTSPIGR
ncbi:uncharacterized protein MKK02DRAFT_42500 [Dioszegia hungarica]|uniref:Uncharacterized protein n=1 Tax=Dioszegia hungarica TaxID=4972 RepID=A0AA38LVM3_9TREE|nr:uncharacterized protein MKK02DRAFT_42500 [Dioszegia hungarica]KAI9638112.1 hypothetical protein MKK02DRAFT_42500 [Dioszegia hungarica]